MTLDEMLDLKPGDIIKDTNALFDSWFSVDSSYLVLSIPMRIRHRP